jgi:hypothetical protein
LKYLQEKSLELEQDLNLRISHKVISARAIEKMYGIAYDISRLEENVS